MHTLYLALTIFVRKRIDSTFLIKAGCGRNRGSVLMNTEEIWHIPGGSNLTSHIPTKVIGSF